MIKSPKEKLSIITEIWNNYILEEPYFQSKIKYDDEVQKNYYGEIMHYISDTINSLTVCEHKLDFNESIFRHIGLLQIMYVHQDLVDEILKIYRLQTSNGSDRKIIRDLRNELIGHPISRGKKGKLNSSTFWGGETTPNIINYIKYINGDISQSSNIKHDINDILLLHNKYLNKYFDQILSKQSNLLHKYMKELNNLMYLINKQPRDIKLIHERSKVLVYRIFSFSISLNDENIIYALENLGRGKRYKYFINYYVDEIIDIIIEQQELISNLVSKIKDKELKKVESEVKDSPVKISYINSTSTKLNIPEPSRYAGKNYYLSKISERRYYEDIATMIKMFCDNPEIVTELKNMQTNYNNDNEYYLSYEYLKFLCNEYN